MEKGSEMAECRSMTFKEFWETLPHCCGYPKCDGSLVGMAHSADCPLFGRDVPNILEVADSFAAGLRSRIVELQTEQQKALRAFYELFGRLGLTMICEATLEQCLVSGINKIDALHATEGRVAELERERWANVCSSDIFQNLKHEPKYRAVLNLLADGQISVGKAAQSIAEIANGCTPTLPVWPEEKRSGENVPK